MCPQTGELGNCHLHRYMVKKFAFLDCHRLQSCSGYCRIPLVFDILAGRPEQDVAVNRSYCQHALAHPGRRAKNRMRYQISGLLVE